MKTFRAALFDLDGVVFDTEPQYDIFWGLQGKLYLPEYPQFNLLIKGTTLFDIFEKYFPNQSELQAKIKSDLENFEHQMPYNYIECFENFVNKLRRAGIKTAVVTSSNNAKMQNVYRAHSEFCSYFDAIITADKITRSKPDPQCFLTAANELGFSSDECVVFEDSFKGLQSGRLAQMFVVGLATSNPRQAIADKADFVIDNYLNLEISDIEDRLNC